jgi:hypothetical protein
MKKKLVSFFKRQIIIKKHREQKMIDRYDEIHVKWQKKVDRFENNPRKKQKDGKVREFYEKFFPELRKQREERERLIQKQKEQKTTAASFPNLTNEESNNNLSTVSTNNMPSLNTNNQAHNGSEQTQPEPNPIEVIK